MPPIDSLVTTDWLEEHLDDPDIRIVDVRGYVTTKLVTLGVEDAAYLGAESEYLAGHIPGAVYIDWTADIIDPDDPVPVQVAPPKRFAEAMASRGIGDSTHVIAVDHAGGQFATRLWWALQYYGHSAVSVLDGGHLRWVDEGRPIAEGSVKVDRKTFTPDVQPGWRVTAEELRDRLGSRAFQLIDARDAGQFTGTRRRGPRAGHIPGAVHFPRDLVFRHHGGFAPLEQIDQALQVSGITSARPTIAYCNGGVAATVCLFHLYRLGSRELGVYDGSWNEWGSREELPIS